MHGLLYYNVSMDVVCVVSTVCVVCVGSPIDNALPRCFNNLRKNTDRSRCAKVLVCAMELLRSRKRRRWDGMQSGRTITGRLARRDGRLSKRCRARCGRLSRAKKLLVLLGLQHHLLRACCVPESCVRVSSDGLLMYGAIGVN